MAGGIRMVAGAQVLLRPGGRIQFGVDPRRALVLQLPDAVPPGGVLAALLADARALPRPTAPLAEALAAAGLAEAAVEALLADLLRAGLARRGEAPAWPPVSVLGRGPLRERLAAAVAGRGGRAIARAPGTRTITWLERTPPARVGLVLLAGMEVPEEALLRALRRRGIAHLSVRLRDGRGLVGPYAAPGGAGGCPGCAEARARQADPAREVLALQLRSAQPTAAPEVIDATVATALAHLGAPAALAGLAAEVDPLGLAPRLTPVPAHPGCPVCAR